MRARPTTHLFTAWAAALALLGACESESGEPMTCAPLVADGDGFTLDRRHRCVDLVKIRPRVRWDGAWIAATGCEDARDEIVCAIPGAGTLSVPANTSILTPRFTASRDGDFGGFELSVTLPLVGQRAWLSNGFHSWSQSGVLAVGPVEPDEDAEAAAGDYGDTEVLRTGETHSWWHTWVAAGDRALVAGVLRADRFRSWATAGSADGVRLRLVTGGVAADTIAVGAGERVAGEPWFVAADGALAELLDDYAKALRYESRRHNIGAVEPEAGWNSWYELWDAVDEEAVRANAALARTLLTPHLPDGAPPLRIVIDDGWQEAWGDWRPNAKFPSGLAGLASDLRDDGFTVGVWLAPLLVDLETDLAIDHPDWLVGGARYDHPVHGRMGVLDVTHPDAKAHLQSVISGLVADGLDLLKIDFLFAGTYGGERAEPVTGMEAFRLAMEAIREAAGEDTILLAVGSPGVPVLPYVDAWRVGGDIALEPFGAGWAWLPNQARSIAARWPLCRAVLCDADPALMRTMAENEVEAGAWIVALGGGGYFLSDDLRALDAERPGWALSPEVLAAALSGEVTPPVDLVPADPPAELVNAIADFLSGESRHVLPSRWGALRLNTTDAPRQIDGETVPARSVLPP